ncbi:MAG: LemA family protein [Acidobacteria bacterium]|nr:LemA family protein [Acidobacteriota bacterium]
MTRRLVGRVPRPSTRSGRPERAEGRSGPAGIVILVAVATLSSGCSYNQFVSQEEAIKTQWAQVENQLQRRNDLVPNLVETTKGVAQQERDVFGQIAESRARLAGAQTPAQTMQAANEQSTALSRLLVVMENYPQLRSSETFNRLMDELAGTENRIAVERMRYNERVQAYNTARRQFPSNITAGIFSFAEYPVFNAPPEAERVPRVDFGRPPP